MERWVSVRLMQAVLGVAYTAVAVAAIARGASPKTGIACVVVAVVTYLTSRTMPDVELPAGHTLRVWGIGVVILALGVLAVVLGKELAWAAVGTSACAANRLRAAGTAPFNWRSGGGGSRTG